MPSGRVGNAKDAIFRSNEHFRGAVGEREAADVAELEHRLDRRLEPAERARIGVASWSSCCSAGARQVDARRGRSRPGATVAVLLDLSCGPYLVAASLQ